MIRAAELVPFLEQEISTAARRSAGRAAAATRRANAEAIRQAGRAKNVNWLKFCHGCGVDISGYPAYVRRCNVCRRGPAVPAANYLRSAREAVDQ